MSRCSAVPSGAGHAADLVKVDVKPLATGYGTSKVLGSTVVNAANETFGRVDDLIVTLPPCVRLMDASGPIEMQNS